MKDSIRKGKQKAGELTPMMQKYIETKNQYPDCILFYRLGDFYEMFFDDAVTASRELEITLTGKSCGLEERAPMCGVPYHAADVYLNKLVSKGYKVAICEQVEDPKLAKGLVKREVTRIVTPGTNIAPQALDETKNNYIMCIVYMSDRFGVAAADITTGDYFVTEVENAAKLPDELFRFMPSEIICNEAFFMSGADFDDIRSKIFVEAESLDLWYFDEELCGKALLGHFKVASLAALGLDGFDCGIISAGALLQYLTQTQKNSLSQLTHISPYINSKFMVLDATTRKNLELTETIREKKKKGSLLWVLDKTKTAMGARLIRKYIEQPLIEKDEITRRLDAVEELKSDAILREELREYLNCVYDMERLITRITYGAANPRDLTAFKASLERLPAVRYILREMKAPLIADIAGELDPLEDVYGLIFNSIAEDPPMAMKEGGIIKDGYNEEVDALRRAKSEGKDWLAKLEEEEREKTGIKNLRIGFNQVFGYYLEVTNYYKNLVPDNYTRKQTLVGAERYTTQKLKDLEEKILGAEDKLISLEYELYTKVREKVAAQVERIQRTAKAVAALDVLISFALVSERNNYVRPKINTKGVIDIKDGRHPVVEKVISEGMFVTNDTYLDDKKNRISIITGPNMAGKSTYMRQTALIVLMAQTGCFVPASGADIGIVDRIFTRVGASDDLALGQSTFMVEMTEVANILRNATKKSLLILDEIGRGTSTFDGLSIAWAVVEYISDMKLLGARTLFATHFHELTELEGKIENVNNYCIAVKERGDDIVFLRKIIKGGADKSYGIQVAKLAGVPELVISRAKEIAEELSKGDITDKVSGISAKEHLTAGRRKAKRYDEVDMGQISLFDALNDEGEVLEELKNIDMENLTPIEALNTIYRLQNRLKNRQ